MSIEIPLPQVHDEGVRIQTVSRIWFPLIEPKVENVRIEDIGCGLVEAQLALVRACMASVTKASLPFVQDSKG
jgi:hypothetical protein